MSDTLFTNEAVSPPSLPAASGLEYEGLAPTYARTMIIEWLATWLFLATVAVGVYFFTPLETSLAGQWWPIAPLLALATSVFVWAPMVAASRGFALRERDIHYKSGIIWQNTVSLPFNRIQHVELESGPLERLFKLTTLKFFTAGGGSADMKIPALTFASASKLRSYVMEKAGVDETDAEGDASTGDSHDNG